MESTQVEVTAAEGGRRLDRFLADRLGVSRARVRHLLDVGRVARAGRTLGLSDKSHSVSPSEVFEVSGSTQASEEAPIPRPDRELVVLAEGVGWLAVDKPAGCGVHPLRPDEDETVLNAVVARYPEIFGVGEGGLRSGVVHRLDVDTTGVLLFAKNEAYWKRLRGAFSEHRVRKRYVALVAGKLEKRRRVDLRLEVKRHSPAHVSVVVQGGHVCRQRIVPKQIFERATLVEVQLETGFLHQIRATLSHLGHPVLGDREYGGVQADGEALLQGLSVARPMLHAASASVDEVSATAAPPADFRELVAQLEADTPAVPAPE